MLHEILRAHDGMLPSDVHCAFTNTGKEDERTLRFGHEIETRWGVAPLGARDAAQDPLTGAF